ncbi:hypothetical protein ACFY2W_15085 [Streptomyces sp. NPDC001262]|uniref:hypothetical protein n=1 Tax=unclassified Streptomyces TaxID=2593676 RepID=UPI003677C2C9
MDVHGSRLRGGPDRAEPGRHHEDRLGLGGWSRTGVIVTASLAAAVASKMLVEDPVRFRARWAAGRRGLVALAAACAALLALWALLPQPPSGAGSVDVTRLAAAPDDPAGPGRHTGSR